MNDLINRVQKDINKLQKTLGKEGEVLIQKIRQTAAKAETKASTKKEEVAKLIQKQIKNFEPALDKFYKGIKTNAGKYGVDIDGIENRVKSTTKKAAAKLNLKKRGKTTGKKKSTRSKAKTKAKTTTAKKTSSKKKTSKKVSKKTN